MDAQQQQQEEQEGESGGGCAGDPCPATPMSPRRPAAMTKPGDGEAAAEEQGQVGGFQTPPGRRTRHSLSPVSQYHTHARRRQSAKPRVLAVLGDLHDADANADVGDEGAATVSPKSEASQEADDEDEEERECAICFSPFLNRSVHRTRCNHYFHRTW